MLNIYCVQTAKKSRHSHFQVSWLRRTEYISTEMTRYQPTNNDKIEATVGYGGRRKAKVISLHQLQYKQPINISHTYLPLI